MELSRMAFDQAWQLTTVVLVVWLTTRIVARNRPHLAYVLWLVVLLKAVTPPVWSSPTGIFSWLHASKTQDIDHVLATPETIPSLHSPISSQPFSAPYEQAHAPSIEPLPSWDEDTTSAHARKVNSLVSTTQNVQDALVLIWCCGLLGALFCYDRAMVEVHQLVASCTNGRSARSCGDAKEAVTSVAYQETGATAGDHQSNRPRRHRSVSSHDRASRNHRARQASGRIGSNHRSRAVTRAARRPVAGIVASVREGRLVVPSARLVGQSHVDARSGALLRRGSHRRVAMRSQAIRPQLARST